VRLGHVLIDQTIYVIAAEATHHGVNKNLKNISIIVSRSADGEFSAHMSSSRMILNLSAIA
jgi:hypothetical protein